MNLFEVRTKYYKTYYVTANGWDEAKGKVQKQIELEHSKSSIFDQDGSLKKLDDIDQVVEIKNLGDKLIS
jgi:hypothetical protein